MVDHVRATSRTSTHRDSAVRAAAARRTQDPDLDALVGKSANPKQADPSSVMALQRKAGNRATVQALRGTTIQRDLSKVARSKRFLGIKPKSVKAIDTSLATLAQKLTMPGALDPIKAALVDVRKAIADFKGSKNGTGKWLKSVTALEGEVLAKEAEIDKKIADKAAKKQLGIDRHAAYATLDPDLARFAKRTQFSDPTLFEDDQAGPSIKNALAGPREAGGELTSAAIKEMGEAAQAKEVPVENEDHKVEFAGLSIDELRAFMNAHTNALTGKTMVPELRNITDPNGQPDKVVTTPMDLGGVTMPVEHNPSDVNLDERLKLVKEAVAKLTAAGVKVPVLRLHMPKYGRGVSVKKATDEAGGKIDCQHPTKSSRAVFIPPDYMHLSSEVIGTPNLSGKVDPATKKMVYDFSSTGFDPSGAATIVHEFGHALHMTTAPAKYMGLWGTAFSGTTQSGRNTDEVAKSEVSEYGGKPREFVAEVFLGLVYGKTFSAEVMEMYRAFGGPIPAAVTAKAAAKAL